MVSPVASAEDAQMTGLVADILREGAALKLLLAERFSEEIAAIGLRIVRCFAAGGKVLVFGNGGSAADAQHIAAEFVGRYVRDRSPYPAIALTTDTSALTSISNDYEFEQVFARQVRALGRAGDIAIAISTSGSSPNVLAGVDAAKSLGIVTVGLTGGDGGALAHCTDHCIVVPSRSTARIQEAHLAIEHLFCEVVDAVHFGDNIGDKTGAALK